MGFTSNSNDYIDGGGEPLTNVGVILSTSCARSPPAPGRVHTRSVSRTWRRGARKSAAPPSPQGEVADRPLAG